MLSSLGYVLCTHSSLYICSFHTLMKLLYSFCLISYIITWYQLNNLSSHSLASPSFLSSRSSLFLLLLLDFPPMDDLMSPFFLHSLDYPGLALVSQPLVGENSGSWSRALKLALSVKNKTEFINGSLQALDVEVNPQQ